MSDAKPEGFLSLGIRYLWSDSHLGLELQEKEDIFTFCFLFSYQRHSLEKLVHFFFFRQMTKNPCMFPGYLHLDRKHFYEPWQIHLNESHLLLSGQ